MKNECQIYFDFDYFFKDLLVGSFSFEESNRGEQPALEQGKPFGFIVISERICALKKVREGWAVDLALPFPRGFLYLKVTLPATCLVQRSAAP